MYFVICCFRQEVVNVPLTAQEAIRKLKCEGWKEVRQAGSHKIFRKDRQMIIVPDHRGDLKPGLEADIRKKAGW